MRYSAHLRRIGAGALACGCFFCLLTPAGLPQSVSAQSTGESPPGDRNPREATLTAQQVLDQHQQLLKALDLLRRDSDANLQRYNLIVDRLRKETDLSLQRFGAAVGLRLDVLNQALAAARERELAALNRSNRLSLAVAGAMVALSVAEILVIGSLLLRAVRRFSWRMTAWSERAVAAATGAGDPGGRLDGALPAQVLHEGNLRLQNAIEQLERRLLELEQSSGRLPSRPAVPLDAVAQQNHVPGNSAKPAPAKAGPPSGVSLTLGAGESLFFLPHEQRRAPLHHWRWFVDRVWKRIQPARAAKEPCRSAQEG